MGLKVIGTTLLAAAAAVLAVLWYQTSGAGSVPLVFSPTQVLNATWHSYLQDYVDPGSARTTDTQRNDVTTSEGQSYTLLRAVWLGDKATFDTAWTFTRTNLQHKDNALFAWLYGKRADGTYGILTAQGGNNSASDADEDIALALVFAYARWQDPAYLTQARSIIQDIWTHEVITVAGVPYLAANDIEKASATPTALINPSYLAPYAYRIFAKVDATHPWGKLVDSSYTTLEKSITAPLDTHTSAGLPPDWVALNKTTGALTVPSIGSMTTNFGYDALRVPFRLALDYAWFADARDKVLLQKMDFLSGQWTEHGSLAGVYRHDGTTVQAAQTPAMYGGAIGYFIVADTDNAQKVYEKKLVSLYNPDQNTWRDTLSYYDNNWAWFGIGLYNHLLPDLSATLPPSAFR